MSLLHEFAAGYALDALDPAERNEFEEHLAGCAVCRGEVAALCETAAELSLLSLATPPPDLRITILDVVRTTPQAPVLVSAAPIAAAGTNGRHPGGPPVHRAAATNGHHPTDRAVHPLRDPGPRRAAFDPDDPDGSGSTDEPDRRRHPRPSRLLGGLLVALVVMAAGLGATVFTLVQERHAQAAQVSREDQLYQAPDAVVTTARLPGGGQVTFIASRQLDRALFIGTDLPDPGRDRYQLWTGTGNVTTQDIVPVRDTQVVAVAAGVKVFFSGDIAGSDFLAVNLEPAGSAPAAPTTDVLAAASL